MNILYAQSVSGKESIATSGSVNLKKFAGIHLNLRKQNMTISPENVLCNLNIAIVDYVEKIYQ